MCIWTEAKALAVEVPNNGMDIAWLNRGGTHMREWERRLNILIILILSGVLLGAYGVQFFWHEEPCPLCMLQRLGMLGVATGLLLNVWFGVRMSHYAIALLSALMGGFVALRQIALHVCPGTPPFGFPVFGLSLYTWSFIVFVCCIWAIAFLLFLYDPKEESKEPLPIDLASQLAFGFIFFMTIANVITTLVQCGLGPCEG